MSARKSGSHWSDSLRRRNRRSWSDSSIDNSEYPTGSPNRDAIRARACPARYAVAPFVSVARSLGPLATLRHPAADLLALARRAPRVLVGVHSSMFRDWRAPPMLRAPPPPRFRLPPSPESGQRCALAQRRVEARGYRESGIAQHPHPSHPIHLAPRLHSLQRFVQQVTAGDAPQQAQDQGRLKPGEAQPRHKQWHSSTAMTKRPNACRHHAQCDQSPSSSALVAPVMACWSRGGRQSQRGGGV